MALSSIPADDAVCYFCLEGADEEGNSLVRDCSCRGNSGFAHLPCLTKYAEQKCKQAEVDLPSFCEPWDECNNCKQPFQNQLAIDLSSACLSFAEATYGHPNSGKWDKMKIMAALHFKIIKLGNSDADRTMLINQLLDMVKQTKKDLNMSKWIHMPKASVEYQFYKILCGHYEAYAYSQSGSVSDKSEEGFKTKIIHYKKARAIYKLFGMNDDVSRMDTIILLQTANKQAAYDSDAITNSALQAMKKMYELTLRTRGMDSEVTIKLGLTYAKGLWNANHCIEAERLVTKLATISRRVHGPDHKITIEAVELLDICKERYVIVLPDDELFQALRYENDGEICVVTGPIIKPRNTADENMYHIANSQVIPSEGCAVICHRLISASHLNGELGEVRDMKEDGTGIRLGVQFEMKGVKSELVKPENLRIAFELPT